MVKLVLMNLLCFLFFEKPGIYNIGKNAGPFSMRIVGIKRVTPAP